MSVTERGSHVHLPVRELIAAVVPVRGQLRRAVHLATRVHCRREHDGSLVRRPDRGSVHSRHAAQDFPLHADHAHLRAQHRTRRRVSSNF